MDGSRILIFMDTKKGCDQITRQLRMDGWPALSIHGDKSQAERDQGVDTLQKVSPELAKMGRGAPPPSSGQLTLEYTCFFSILRGNLTWHHRSQIRQGLDLIQFAGCYVGTSSPIKLE